MAQRKAITILVTMIRLLKGMHCNYYNGKRSSVCERAAMVVRLDRDMDKAADEGKL